MLVHHYDLLPMGNSMVIKGKNIYVPRLSALFSARRHLTVSIKWWTFFTRLVNSIEIFTPVIGIMSVFKAIY